MIDPGNLCECVAMGHGLDFCTGREMVIGGADDISDELLRAMCRIWGADLNEVWLGIEYQRGIEAAAKRMIAAKRKI